MGVGVGGVLTTSPIGRPLWDGNAVFGEKLELVPSGEDGDALNPPVITWPGDGVWDGASSLTGEKAGGTGAASLAGAAGCGSGGTGWDHEEGD